ncbi:hypothetical protein BJ912DRAFT_1054772 [Pholiota molesta]|nr:hypothetical protein BJ912DRAFT_1054772 [Pholiota molesta]
MRVALGLAVALVTLGDMITNGVLATWLRSCSRLSWSRTGAMAEGPQSCLYKRGGRWWISEGDKGQRTATYVADLPLPGSSLFYPTPMFLNVVRGHRCRVGERGRQNVEVQQRRTINKEFKLRFGKRSLNSLLIVPRATLTFSTSTVQPTSAAPLTTRLIKIRPSKYGDQGMKKKGKTRREGDLKVDDDSRAPASRLMRLLATAVPLLRLNGALAYPSPCAPPLQRGMWAGSSSTTTTMASNDLDPWRTTSANNDEVTTSEDDGKRWRRRRLATARPATTTTSEDNG